jgi:hypothetical protein
MSVETWRSIVTRCTQLEGLRLCYQDSEVPELLAVVAKLRELRAFLIFRNRQLILYIYIYK